jgi:hypothetical protein
MLPIRTAGPAAELELFESLPQPTIKTVESDMMMILMNLVIVCSCPILLWWIMLKRHVRCFSPFHLQFPKNWLARTNLRLNQAPIRHSRGKPKIIRPHEVL